MYFLPGVFEHEVNTAIFEERTRDRTNPTGQGNVNVKFIYSDSSEILKYAQLFRSKEEIKVFFDKFGE